MTNVWTKNYPIPLFTDDVVKHPDACPDCGGVMTARLQANSRWHYYCVNPTCRGNVSADEAGRPYGIPIDAAGREKRMEAHDLLDPIWLRTVGNDMQSVRSVRTQVYLYLQLVLDMEHFSIGHCNHEQLDKLLVMLKHGTVERYIKWIMGIETKGE